MVGFLKKRMRLTPIVASMLLLATGAEAQQREFRGNSDSALTVVLAGQMILLVDPRESREEPFGSIRPILRSADVAFTNFEGAVMEPDDRCGLPDWYLPLFRLPRLRFDRDRPSSNARPSAAEASVMEFLSDLGFNLMSLANNHSWDLGACGVEATRAAAARHGIVDAGTGSNTEQATAPAYLDADGVTVALVAATTTRDDREVVAGRVNGVWLARQDDWERNLAAVREAAQNADVVIYYQHFQMAEWYARSFGHGRIDSSLERWQTDFARAIIDVGATVYIAHGETVFDGVEIYEGRPIVRQLGSLAAQGGYRTLPDDDDDNSPWRGILAELTLRDGAVESIEVLPLDMDHGEAHYNTLDFLKRRGTAELATGSLALDILERFRQRSANYGTEVEIRGERAVVRLSGR